MVVVLVLVSRATRETATPSPAATIEPELAEVAA
jgi:hypothetical protein